MSNLARVWAPGRINLIGEHTDHAGGFVLPAAIDFGITLDVAARAQEVTLVSAAYGAAAPVAADGQGAPAQGWARYVQAVAVELALLGRPPVGLNGSISSNLPAGKGVSSSAALEIAVALALCAVAEWQIPPLELALACQRAELRAVGVPCGILDQAACVLGRRGAAILIDCSTLEHEPVPVPGHAVLLLIDSLIERSLENTEYGRRKDELARALAGADDAVSARRLRHLRTENERVHAFAHALARDDLEGAGHLMSESHASLRDDFEVSIPELDLIVEQAEQSGAYGARMHGGGFGGAVLVLTDRQRLPALAERFPGRTLLVSPGSGAGVSAAQQ
ncbi:MAG TPA: galactokinase family protein [Gaiellaceae bacterium]|jgi:galactokinase|nr:galactokinase family protein [Gaiellaceae bacterium]